MADTKISALSPAAYLDGSEEFALAQASANEKATISQILGGSYCVLQSDYTLTSTTSSQKLFNSTTNGALTLPTGVYLFEAMLYLTNMSATAGNGAFLIVGAGTATLATARTHMRAVGLDFTAPKSPGTHSGSGVIGANAFSSNLVSTLSGTGLTVSISGHFDVTSTGTIIPSFALLTAAAAVVKAGTFFRCQCIGPTATATLGNWS